MKQHTETLPVATMDEMPHDMQAFVDFDCPACGQKSSLHHPDFGWCPAVQEDQVKGAEIFVNRALLIATAVEIVLLALVAAKVWF